jgi:ribosomal protein S18 acetylase RimI-like enzyme
MCVLTFIALVALLLALGVPAVDGFRRAPAPRGRTSSRTRLQVATDVFSDITTTTTRAPPPPAAAAATAPPVVREMRFVKIEEEQDVLCGAELCVTVFFGDAAKERNLFRRLNIERVLRKCSYDLLMRFLNRPRDDAMVKAVRTSTDEMVGYAEVFVTQLESSIYRTYLAKAPAQKRLIDVDGRIFVPKLTNLAVVPEARQQGVGKQLVRSCLRQAHAWGFDQIVLTVEQGNADGRSFYRRLGFEELFVDYSEHTWDVSGLFLGMVRVPKVWMRKVVDDADLVDDGDAVPDACDVDVDTGVATGPGCDDGMLSSDAA